MKQKRKITNKTFVLTAVIGSLLIMALLTVNTIWISRQTSTATDEAVSAVSSFYLEAMADRRAKTITNLISNSFDQMAKAVAFIADEKVGIAGGTARHTRKGQVPAGPQSLCAGR